MAIKQSNRRIQTIVSKDIDMKIEYLAERMECSKSSMTAMLLEAAIDDNEWIIKAITLPLSKKIIRALDPAFSKKRREKEQGA